MSDGDEIAALRHQLVSTAGGYLRNLIRDESTCQVCYTPWLSAPLCWRCARDSAAAGLPDARGFMTYASHAEPVQQSGYMMRAYKASVPSQNARRTVALLAALALRGHRECPGRLAGAPLTAWACVPSLPPKGDASHALRKILKALARPGSVEIALRGVDHPTDPRELNASNFIVDPAAAPGAHVLLVDDTWTGGGHAQSAALSLRNTGVTHVSLLVLARWLTVGYGDTTTSWMRSRLMTPDYDTNVCPWTQGGCPT